MLAKEEFANSLKEFVNSYSKINPEALFTLYESNGQIYAEQRQLIENNNKKAHRLIGIIYNEAYSAPVLWFNFYDPSGKILYLEEFETFLKMDFTSADILKGISQNEHPIHGIAFYNIHPCKTAEFMKNLTHEHYITSWLSVYGAILGLDVNKVFMV